MRKLQANPTPQAFARTWTEDVLRPAVEKLSGTDGKLSKAEAANTSGLTGAAKLAADNMQDVFTATKARSSTSVATALKAGEKLALAAAKSVAGADGKLSAEDMKLLAKFNADFGFLLKSSPKVEQGVVSDLDSTVIPPEKNGVVPAPYPGIAALYRELEFGKSGTAGDVHYVTARSPDRVVTVPAYLDTHELPAGSIDTGISQLPWVAQPEKVRDISRLFEANPGQKFVLFGDTLAKDPEVYREIAAKYPDQVTAVFIHKVNATVNPQRVEGQHLVENYAQAAAQLYKDGVFTKAAALRVMKSAQGEGLAITTDQMNALLA